MSTEVKRYEAVHLRYDDNNIRYGEGCEVEVVLASDYATLEAELAKLRAGQEPVAAQVRFRRPEKGLADWSVWQQTTIKPNMPAWSIDSASYEVEYRLLYTTPQPSAVPDYHIEQVLLMVPAGWKLVPVEPTPEMRWEAIQHEGGWSVRARDKWIAMLAAAPYPATVQGDESLPGEVLGQTCADGGRCHHKCERRCFRRHCCVPFNNYTGPWRYSNQNDPEGGKA